MIASHGNYGNQDTIEEVKSRFQKHADGTEALTSDLKSAVFTMVMTNGDEKTFDQLVKVSALCMCACEHVHAHAQCVQLCACMVLQHVTHTRTRIYSVLTNYYHPHSPLPSPSLLPQLHDATDSSEDSSVHVSSGWFCTGVPKVMNVYCGRRGRYYVESRHQ